MIDRLLPVAGSVLALSLMTAGPVAAQGIASELPRARTELAKPIVRVPMSHTTGHVAVDVTVDGKGPFVFLLDTGASGHGRVDMSLVERLSLQRVGRTTNDDSTGQNVSKLGLFRVDSIRLGDATFRGLTVAGSRYAGWLDRQHGKPVVGILGFELFRDVLLTIDYPARTIELSTGALPRDDRHVIPYQTWNGIPFAKAQLGPRRFLVAIDTGSDGGLILPEAWLDGLVTAAPPKLVATARTVNNEFPVKGTELREPLFLAGHSLGWVTASFARIWRRPNLGYRALQQFALTFDQRQKRLRFRDGSR